MDRPSAHDVPGMMVAPSRCDRSAAIEIRIALIDPNETYCEITSFFRGTLLMRIEWVVQCGKETDIECNHGRRGRLQQLQTLSVLSLRGVAAFKLSTNLQATRKSPRWPYLILQ